ncbi:hypothetical protein ACFSOV_00030 [Pedobacter petrophilus]|uniref:hypothetical protein n=1 Tax=Pedobacter petrophilus TaxID=1908241 RepID=UPI00363FF4F9
MVVIFATFASRFGGNGWAEKQVNDVVRGIKEAGIILNKTCRCEKNHYLCHPLRKEWIADWKVSKFERQNRDTGLKIKFILFGIW